MERHFSAGHSEELLEIFTRLADFMHEHELQQVVSAGPSAAPFAKAVARAYEKRHGKPISVVNLGGLGEKLARTKRIPSFRYLNSLLQRRKPGFDSGKKTLLFDEAARWHGTINGISKVFTRMNVPHKTAVIAVDQYFASDKDPDFVGTHELHGFNSLTGKVSIGLTRRLQGVEGAGPLFPFMRRLNAELREITDRVPRKE